MRVIICLLVIGISLTAVAQHDKDHDQDNKKERFKKFMPYMTRTLGGSFQSFDAINARVANLPQYEQLKDYAATIGLGWLKEKNQFVSSGAINLGSSMSGHRDEKSSTIRYIGVNLNLGYDVIKSDRFMLYPLAGLGLQKYQAIFYKDNSAVSFNEVLQSPTVQNNISSVKFNNAFALYRFGLGFSVKAPKYPAAIGIEAGYTGSFKKHEWRSNEDQTLANAPEDRVSQFFVSLVLMSKPFSMMR